ncbi:hypothetical protein KC949_01295 [Candidatus Saccharibacteria bacterium]|nr:hypothetical protein [Candidatus Saccharibacteria bacterium]
MSDKKTLQEIEKEHRDSHFAEKSMQYWRSWGSWFSWGSPVGLGLFFIETAVAAWIVAQIVK